MTAGVSDAVIGPTTLQRMPDKPSASANSSLFELTCSISSHIIVLCIPINEWQSHIIKKRERKSSIGETERLSPSSFQHQLAEESI